jgi:hypothetical protein
MLIYQRVMENPNLKWMITRGTHILGNLFFLGDKDDDPWEHDEHDETGDITAISREYILGKTTGIS